MNTNNALSETFSNTVLWSAVGTGASNESGTSLVCVCGVSRLGFLIGFQKKIFKLRFKSVEFCQ